MHLLKKLIKKNLDENFNTSSISKTNIGIEVFYVNNVQYVLTQNHLNTIRTLLKGTFQNNLVIDDEKFSIAGGSILTLMMYGSPFLIRDIDIFPNSESDYNKLKDKLDLSIKKELGKIFENENSRNYEFAGTHIDLVKKFSTSTKECISNFDLSVVQMGFNEKFEFTSLVSLEDVFNFKMKLGKPFSNLNAFTKLRRILKYSEKGFTLYPKTALMEIFATIKTGETSLSEEFEQRQKFAECFREVVAESKKGYHDLVTGLKATSASELDWGELKLEEGSTSKDLS